MDYEADAAKVGKTFKGQLAKAYMGLRSLPTPFNIASRALGNISDFVKEQAAKRAEAQAKAAAAAAAQMQYENRRDETGGYQSSFGQDTGFMEGSGTSKDMGSFKDGGLVSMFVEKK